MARAGDRFALTNHETVVVRTSAADSGGDLLELEAEWTPTRHGPPKHFHPAQDEHVEVTAGELHVHLDGQPRIVRPGETVEVPRGAVHTMWAGGGETTRAIWQVRPALRTEDFLAGMVAARGDRPVASVFAVAPLLREYSDVFRLAIPAGVQRPLLGLLAAIGRVRGRR
jgi:mannose-6-phosphate isomerase-like protein (cupin superfamily)